MKTNCEPDDIRHEWAARIRRRPARQYGADIRCPMEAWRFEYEEFPGAWMLEDAGRHLTYAAAAQCAGRMLVARVVALVIRQSLPCDELAKQIEAAHAYLGGLKLAPLDVWSAKRALGALQPFDMESLGAELLRLSLMAAGEGYELSARSLALLAYDAAVAHSAHREAQNAAHAVARLAAMQECPRVARRWRAVAYLHGKQADRASEAQMLDE